LKKWTKSSYSNGKLPSSGKWVRFIDNVSINGIVIHFFLSSTMNPASHKPVDL